MDNIYHSPSSNVIRSTAEIPLKKKILDFILIVIFCLVAVTYISPFINDLYVHLIVDRYGEHYRLFRLASDLIQSSVFLFAAGYMLGSIHYKTKWLPATLLVVILVANSFRIIGFWHIIEGDCSYLWYDIAIIVKTPIAIYCGSFFNVKT